VSVCVRVGEVEVVPVGDYLAKKLLALTALTQQWNCWRLVLALVSLIASIKQSVEWVSCWPYRRIVRSRY
jgi:type II secretory pathway component PulL